MKRPFPRFEVLAAALAAGAACTPNNSVKPGAPVLMELAVVENGGAQITTVTQTTTTCPDKTAEGGGCPTALFPATFFPPTGQTFYTPCQTTTDNIVCRCIPNPIQPPLPTSDAGASDGAVSDAGNASTDAGATDAGGSMADAGDAGGSPILDGTWSCSFVPTANALYVFDRLLDTKPFDPNMGVPNVATLSTDPPNGRVTSSAAYASNGLQNQTIFRFLAYPDGPNITITGSPALPTSSTVTVMLDKTMVRAKDGTPFTAMGLLIDGAVKFVTQAFAVVAVTPPPPPMGGPADAAPAADMMPATVTFNNFINVTTLAAHITASDATGPIAVDLASMDNLTVTVTPKADWPAGTQITISVDAMTPDAVGDVLGALAAPTPVQFTTGAM